MIASRRFHARPRARVPETEQRSRLARDRGIRQVVFGAQDGVLTTLGIVSGVGAGTGDSATVLLTGFVALLVGALSMGVGDYISGRTERHVLERALETEREEMRTRPGDEVEEQIGFYQQKGFTREEAEMIVRRLVQHPEIWLHEMMRDEFGIDPRDIEESGVRDAVAMGASFAGGALVPVLPCLLGVTGHAMVLAALAAAAVALFGIGWRAGRLSGRTPWKKGLEVVGAGTLVFAASYVAGHLIPAVFGRPPVSG